MKSKLLVIIATGEKGKALTGLMFAYNAIKNKWFTDIQVQFFGPFENLVIFDEQVTSEVRKITEIGQVLACKYISDRENISEKLESLGVSVEYVGPVITELINDGYIPMVW